jgi:hypothetical protein
MATQTYFEQSQAIYFRAAREMRKVAAQVLHDMQNDVELTSDRSHEWARGTAKHYADQANALDEAGYAITHLIPAGTETANRRSRELYSHAIDAYERRRTAARERVTPAA